MKHTSKGERCVLSLKAIKYFCFASFFLLVQVVGGLASVTLTGAGNIAYAETVLASESAELEYLKALENRRANNASQTPMINNMLESFSQEYPEYPDYPDYPDYPYERNDNIQIKDLTEQDINEIVNAIMGSGVQLLDVRYTGNDTTAASFTTVNSEVFGFNQGIVLSTGSVHDIPGPNFESGITTPNGLDGDPALDKLIPGYQTYDATILEFDFIPTHNMLSFEYVFSSDEYNEFVGSQYNDVFGFFLNGQNIALIPDTATPVSINNVNAGNELENWPPTNAQYYRDNDKQTYYGIEYDDIDNDNSAIDIEMDGLTTVLTAQGYVTPGQKNTIKLAIADAGDGILDSNVFIKTGSFKVEERDMVQIAKQTNYFNENAGTAEILVTRTGNLQGPVTVNYSISDGSAVAGTDYSASQTGTILFDDGVGSKTIAVDIIDNELAEGNKTFIITLSQIQGNAFIGSILKSRAIIEDNDTGGAKNLTNWEPMEQVPAEKNFRVDFSKPLDSVTVNPQNFYVTDADGNLIPNIVPELTYDECSVVMKRTGYFNYVYGQTYYLNITADVKTKAGMALNTNIKMPFTIKDLT